MSKEITHNGGAGVLPQPSNAGHHAESGGILARIPHIPHIPHLESPTARFVAATLPYAVLYAIAVVLIAMTDHNPASAKVAWDYFIPLVGLVSATGGWNQHAGHTGYKQMSYILRQIVHWGALMVVIHLLFLSDVQYFLRAEADGFFIIYLVGLASIMAGIYLNWKMAIFGLFLIFSGVIIAYLDDNALLIAVGGIATMAVVVTAFAWIRFHQHEEPQ
jgi:hypothetical protein